MLQATLLQARSRLSSRSGSLVIMAGLFIIINTLVRASLMALSAPVASLTVAQIAQVFAAGAAFDLAALSWMLVPFVVLSTLASAGRIGRTIHASLTLALAVLALNGMLFIAVAEHLFWNEFASRFNFIAVDYLIYTREVLGNIRQSYPVEWILAGIALVGLLVLVVLRQALWRSSTADPGSWRSRAGVAVALLSVPAWTLGSGSLDGLRQWLKTPLERELAANGYVEFVRAFTNNDLDYQTFYKTVPDAVVKRNLEAAFGLVREHLPRDSSTHPVQRVVKAAGPSKPLHVVLVSMESLGADYVESFGATRRGLTPHLDALASEGVVFSSMYATGLRTVRGLEALTLSIPPTPGHAVPMRVRNKGLQTLGSVLEDNGYEALYVYGGYARFDNMRDFFGGNGYTVIDRSAIPSESISHETVWGVADEDLFNQALGEIDTRVSKGTRVFAHIMTTSNHRPFTYPADRIDIAPGSGREGAVKYADYALGKFMTAARQRPWFKDTLFVLVADHTSNGRGRTDLPPENYRIPLVIYAPAHLGHQHIHTLGSQIDVAPTVLGLLNVSYTSRFFGKDLLAQEAGTPRAFMANYLTVGYMEGDLIVELSPKQRSRVINAKTGETVAQDGAAVRELVHRAISFYQAASQALSLASADAAPKASP